MGRMRIGGDEHKERFCRMFVETHDGYDPEQLDWPELDDASLERLRGLPFWGEAVGSERTAAARVRSMADVESEPMLREAIALQAYEEERHARLLEIMLRRYQIPFPDVGPQRPRDAEWGFLRMGYGECFDSFFAFGLFRVAADTNFFPPVLVKLFDGVMQEEARHILFFSNWAIHRGHQLPLMQRPWFHVRRALGVTLQAFGRVKTAIDLKGVDTDKELASDGDNFTMQVPESMGDISMRGLAETCLRENERRLGQYDPELLRPKMVPNLVGLAMRFAPKDEPAGSAGH